MFALLDTLPGLSLVSVGHRPSLVQFHDTKLKLTSVGYDIESTGSGRETGVITKGTTNADIPDSIATDVIETRGGGR